MFDIVSRLAVHRSTFKPNSCHNSTESMGIERRLFSGCASMPYNDPEESESLLISY